MLRILVIPRVSLDRLEKLPDRRLVVDLGLALLVALDELKRRLDAGDWFNKARHNELNFGPDGMLLPKWAYTDNPDDNAPVIYSEFEQFSNY